MKLADLKRLKKFKAKRTYHGKYAREEMDELRAAIEVLVLGAGGRIEDIKESDVAFSWENRSFLKPKAYRHRIGVVEMMSGGNYKFTSEDGVGYGQGLKAADVTENGFNIVCERSGNLIFSYEILD